MSIIVHLFNGLKGFMVVSGQRSGDRFYWRPCLPGTRQYGQPLRINTVRDNFDAHDVF